MKSASSALQALAGNLKRMVGRNPEQRGSSAIAPKADVDAKTISEWKRGKFGKNGPTLIVVEKVALELGMPAWQILLPEQDRRTAELVQAYTVASPEWRETLERAAKAARDASEKKKGGAVGG